MRLILRSSTAASHLSMQLEWRVHCPACCATSWVLWGNSKKRLCPEAWSACCGLHPMIDSLSSSSCYPARLWCCCDPGWESRGSPSGQGCLVRDRFRCDSDSGPTTWSISLWFRFRSYNISVMLIVTTDKRNLANGSLGYPGSYLFLINKKNYTFIGSKYSAMILFCLKTKQTSKHSHQYFCP